MAIRFILLVTALLSTTFVKAQFTFDKLEHDFGLIEMTDSIEYDFVARNTSESAAKILSVEAECSCAVAAYNQDAIPPKENTSITVRYYPYHYGVFRKKITVKTTTNSYTINITGEVKKPLNPLQKYPYMNGDLLTATRYANFGRLTTEKVATQRFELYNPHAKDIYFSSKIIAPEYITVKYENPPLVPAKKSGNLYISYDPAAKNDYGFVTDSVEIYLKDIEKPLKIYVNASIEQYFPEIPDDQLDHHPRIKFQPEKIDLGYIYKNKDSIIAEIDISNTGDQALKILKVIPGPGLELLTPLDSILTIGDLHKDMPPIKVKMRFIHVRRTGKQQRRLTIISNDPKQHIKNIKISATLK